MRSATRRTPDPGAPRSASGHLRVALAAAIVLVLATATARADSTLPLPGPAPRDRVGAVVGIGALAPHGSPSMGACAGCHEEIAAEWRGSLHRRAWVDPVFQSAYRVEPLAFCRSCHAPEADPSQEPTAAAQDEGVGCLACHVAGSHITSGHGGDGASHPVRVDARLATAAACSGCHQFDFPEGANQRVPEPMQDTAAEHARSRFADTPCQQCHMPWVTATAGSERSTARHRSHAFTVIGDAAILRRAARVSASRETPGTVVLTIEAGEVGHAFPTGDMFRRLEARAEAVDGRGRVIAEAPPVLLARQFADVPRDPDGDDLGFQRITARDTRVAPPGTGPPRRVELRLPPRAGALRLRWRLLYQRMSTPMASAFRANGVNEAIDTVTIAEGTLPAPIAKAPASPPALAHSSHRGGAR